MKSKDYILLYLLTFLAAVGCANIYAVLWRVLGLPLAWWSAVVTAVLGMGSIWGLVEWITRQWTEDQK